MKIENGRSSERIVFCTAENRASHADPLKILAASLYLHDPDTKLVLFHDKMTSEFLDWCRLQSNIELREFAFEEGVGWSIKPRLLLLLLGEGFTNIAWLDSDMIVNKSLSKMLSQFDQSALIVAEEALAGRSRDDKAALRAQLWNFRIGRWLGGVANTCVVRITNRHRTLLECWISKMQEVSYLEAQRINFSDRPLHLGGDQDVLTALLSADDFSDLKITFLKRGKDIIQFYGPYGFTTFERLRSLVFGMPTLVHSQAHKPWIFTKLKDNSMKDKILGMMLDLSPYKLLAAKLKPNLLTDQHWTTPSTKLGRLLMSICLGSPIMSGLVFSFIADMFRAISWTHQKTNKYTHVR